MSVFPLSRPRALWPPRRAHLGMAVFLAVVVQGHVAVCLAGNPRFYGTTTLKKVLDDVHLYQDYADRMLSGEVPYRDFRVEYPPLALPFFVVPAWLAGGTFSNFWMLFGAEMLLLHAANLALVAWWVRRSEGPRTTLLRLLWATLLFLPLAQLSVSRFDLAPTLVLFSAAVLWAVGKPGLSGVLGGLGVLVKIVPGVVLGPMLADEVCRWKETRLRGSLAGLVAVVLGVAGWVVAVGGPGAMRASLRYHLDRGLEAGSLGAGVLMGLGKILQWPVRTEYLFKSTQVVAPGDSWVSSLAFPIQALALLTVMVAFVRRGRAEPLRYAGASVLAFLLFGKVLSPQYLLWIYPFVLVVEGRAGQVSRLLFLAVGVLSLLLYPWGAHRLAAVDPAAIVVLNLRNGLLLALWGFWVFGPVRAASRNSLRKPLNRLASPERVAVLFPVDTSASGVELDRQGRAI